MDTAQEPLAAAGLPLGEADHVGLVVPLGAHDGGARLTDDVLEPDEPVLQVAAVPEVLLGDPVEPLDVEDEHPVVDALGHGRGGCDLAGQLTHAVAFVMAVLARYSAAARRCFGLSRKFPSP
jgi:hypothetical protein